MTLNHEEIKAFFPEYLKGTLPEKVKSDIEAHIGVCEECRGELTVLSELFTLEVPDPGNFFWKNLPAKVRGAVEKEKPRHVSLRSWLWRALPAAAAIVILVSIISVFKKEREVPELAYPFKGPFTVEVIDYGDITQKDVQVITKHIVGDDMYVHPCELVEYSYHREVAYLGSKDMEGLSELLERELKRGG